MKRSFALTLTVVIFAAIAVCFLRPADLNPDFGCVDEVLAFPNALPVETFGDTDLMTVESVERYGAQLRVNFVPVDGVKILPGSAIYAYGARTMTEKHFHGYIEKLEDGGWRFYDRLFTRKANSLFGDDKLQVKSEPYSDMYMFPFHSPGRYRVNFYFREYIREEDRAGDDLYTISFETEVEPASSRRFDVCSFGAGGGEHGIEMLSFILRANEDETPYLDIDSARMERSEESTDVPIAGGYTRSSDILYFFEDLRDSVGAPFVSEYLLYFDEPVPAGEYMLTMIFTEHPDGSGEQYTLTLNLRFDE